MTFYSHACDFALSNASFGRNLRQYTKFMTELEPDGPFEHDDFVDQLTV